MSTSEVNSSILTAGRDVNIETKYTTRDIVYNYYLASQCTEFKSQEFTGSPKPLNVRTGGSSPSQLARIENSPKRHNKSSKDELLKAAKEGNMGVIKSMLDHGIDINSSNDDGRTALHLAAASGCIEAVNFLLSYPEVGVGARDKEERTPFLLAAQNGHMSIVKVLLGHPSVNINARDRNGFSALNLAAEMGRVDVLRLLHQPTIDVNNKISIGNTALLGAVWRGEKECVRALIEHPDVDLNYRNKHGITALEMAALVGKPEIAALLRNQGASPASPAAAATSFLANWFSG